ncbi:MAG: methionine--tRNA ligase [Gemmatimonadales bacterium]
MTDRFYITTAIDYSNGEPHLGHAYEKIGADCVARYRRLRGAHVDFVIGMDEHGQKVAQSAEAAEKDPQEWVDEIATQFRAAWKELSISNTDFIRTTEPRHRRSVEALFRRIRDAGYISEGVYSGYYCDGCEGFKAEKDLDEKKRCPIHPTREIRWLDEPNYFFKIGAFRQRLLNHYEKHPEFVRPRAKLNEVANVVRSWTDDQLQSVSRASLPWGIPWPDDETHTVYVWFEALTNYLSATGFPDEGYDSMWPAQVHVIGPDIVRFHAAMWPAMLMAAGVDVPEQVWCHGWVNTAGARFSKSAGVSVTLRNLIDRHGPDALRYYLLREIPWDSDGSFTWERFDVRYTSELADGYGNLISRVLAMIRKYADGVVPDAGEPTELDRLGDTAIARYREAMDQHLLHDGASAAWTIVARANRFVEESAPWSLAKEGKRGELDAALASLARAISRTSLLLAPFLPGKTQLVWQALGREGDIQDAAWREVERPQVAGRRVNKLTPLFPKSDSGT